MADKEITNEPEEQEAEGSSEEEVVTEAEPAEAIPVAEGPAPEPAEPEVLEWDGEKVTENRVAEWKEAYDNRQKWVASHTQKSQALAERERELSRMEEEARRKRTPTQRASVPPLHRDAVTEPPNLPDPVDNPEDYRRVWANWTKQQISGAVEELRKEYPAQAEAAMLRFRNQVDTQAMEEKFKADHPNITPEDYGETVGLLKEGRIAWLKGDGSVDKRCLETAYAAYQVLSGKTAENQVRARAQGAEQAVTEINTRGRMRVLKGSSGGEAPSPKEGEKDALWYASRPAELDKLSPTDQAKVWAGLTPEQRDKLDRGEM